MKALAAWWQERADDERRWILVGLALFGLLLLYFLAFQPAFSGRMRLDRNLPALRQQVASMDLQAQLARQLDAQGTLQTPSGQALRDALGTSMHEHGLESKTLTQAGSGVRIELHDVPFANWVDWLDEVRAQLHVKVSEAHVNSLKPGQVDVTATLSPP